MGTDGANGKDRVLEALRSVYDPEIGENIVDLDMVKKVEFEGNRVSLTVSLTVPGCPLQGRIKRGCRRCAFKALYRCGENRLHIYEPRGAGGVG